MDQMISTPVIATPAKGCPLGSVTRVMSVALITTGLLGWVHAAEAAVYNYDFGTSTAALISGSSSSSSTTLLPAPPAGGGSTFARVGTGGGSVALENPGNTLLGSGSELVLTAAKSTSSNKASIVDYSGASALATLSLSAYVSGTMGNFSLVTGNGDNFASGVNFTGNQTFAFLQFSLSGGVLTTTYRQSITATPAFTGTGLTTTGFKTDTVLGLQLVQNNSVNAAIYNVGGSTRTVGANTFDLYLDGTLVGDDLATGSGTSTLADGTSIDSFMLYGESSTSPDNNAVFRMDDVSYTTDQQAAPEPATAALVGLAGMTLLGSRRRSRFAAIEK